MELLGHCAVRGNPRGISISVESLGKGGEEGKASLKALKGLAVFGDGAIILSVLKRMESTDSKVCHFWQPLIPDHKPQKP